MGIWFKFTRLHMDIFHDDVEDSREKKTLLKIAYMLQNDDFAGYLVL